MRHLLCLMPDFTSKNDDVIMSLVWFEAMEIDFTQKYFICLDEQPTLGLGLVHNPGLQCSTVSVVNLDRKSNYSQWYFRRNGMIFNDGSGFPLDVRYGHIVKGAFVQTYTYHDEKNQHFHVESDGYIYCAALVFGRTSRDIEEGAEIVLTAPNEKNALKFRLKPVGETRKVLNIDFSKQAQYVIFSEENPSMVLGTIVGSKNVILTPYTDAMSQRWCILEDGVVVHVLSGLVWDLAGGMGKDRQLIVYPYHGRSNQKFFFPAGEKSIYAGQYILGCNSKGEVFSFSRPLPGRSIINFAPKSQQFVTRLVKKNTMVLKTSTKIGELRDSLMRFQHLICVFIATLFLLSISLFYGFMCFVALGFNYLSENQRKKQAREKCKIE